MKLPDESVKPGRNPFVWVEVNQKLSKTSKTEKPVKDLETLQQDNWGATPLNAQIGKRLTIESLEFKQGVQGEAVILGTTTGRYYTFSGPVIKQAKDLQPELTNYNIRVTPQHRVGAKGRTYIVLE